MMNKLQFEQEKQRVIGLCSYRPVEGAIRFSNKEGRKHFDKKCELCWDIENKGSKNRQFDYPKWYKPCFFTEVRFKNGARGDVILITPEGTLDFEIADTEAEKSLKRKERLYEKMGIKMVVVRC